MWYLGALKCFTLNAHSTERTHTRVIRKLIDKYHMQISTLDVGFQVRARHQN